MITSGFRVTEKTFDDEELEADSWRNVTGKGRISFTWCQDPSSSSSSSSFKIKTHFTTTTDPLSACGGGTHVEVGLVDLVDDLQVSGQQRLQQLDGPPLQSLGQDRVVGVGEGASGQIPGLQSQGRSQTS